MDALKIRDTSAQDVTLAVRPNRRRWLWPAVGALIALLFLVIVIPRFNQWLAAEQSINAERIRTALVERGSFVRDVGVQGRIIAAVSPTLYSPVTGTVSLHVKPGDEVQLGDILAEVRSPEVDAEYEQELSTLQRLGVELDRQHIESRKSQFENQQTVDLAKVRLTAAQREMRRAEKSIQVNAISDIEYQRYKDDLATTDVEYAHATQDALLAEESLDFEMQTRQLELERQQLLVDNHKRRVDELTIRAPVGGIIGNVLVEQKAAVIPNQALITVVDLSAFEVELRIPETYADELGIGMSVDIQYANAVYPGQLSALSPEVANNEVVGRAKFISGSPAGLRQNQRVQARIVIDELTDVLKLPRGAFADTGSGRIAFVLDSEGLAQKRTITLGSRSVSEIVVIDGLREGEEIVISNISEFADADVIRITE